MKLPFVTSANQAYVADYKPSKYERWIAAALKRQDFEDFKFRQPKYIDFSEESLQESQAFAKRVFSEDGVTIKYERILYPDAPKKMSRRQFRGLISKINDPASVWHIVSFENDNNQPFEMQFFPRKSMELEVQNGDLGILVEGLEKATGLDLHWSEEYAETREQFSERLKKLEDIKSVYRQLSGAKVAQYAEEKGVPQFVVEEYIRHDGNVLKSNVMLGYLLGSNNGCNAHYFLRFLQKQGINLSPKKLIQGFVYGAFEDQEHFVARVLRNAEETGRDIIRTRIEGQKKDLDFTGHDILLEKCREAMGGVELFISEEERVKYVVRLVDGMLFEAIKRTK